MKDSYKKKLLLGLIVFAVLICSIFVYSTFIQEEGPVKQELSDMQLDARLTEFSKRMVRANPSKDGIPPIDNPKYISIEESEGFLEGEDAVFVIESGPLVKVFPQKIMVWHEIVNDEIQGEMASITYCPLTGSAIGFKGAQMTFGTTGKLVNSNLVMYDRETDSEWPQILGQAVSGSQKGAMLKTFPVIWTTWESAKSRYPDALVLSTDTGFLRSYGTDPYGSYLRKGTYYDSGGPFFAVMVEDNRLREKEVVTGIRINGHALAVVKSSMAEKKVVNLIVGGRPVVALYDESLASVRVYIREIDDEVLSFEVVDGMVFDMESGSQWNFSGEAVNGKFTGVRMDPADSFEVMWFGWVSFYPQTELITG